MDQAFSFRALGYPVSVGWGSVIVMGLYGFMSSREVSPMGLLEAVLGALIFGVSILVHELGHAVVANRLGMRVVGIRMHGLGGNCDYRGQPTAGRRLLIALAGPGAGLALGALAIGLQFVVLPATPGLPSLVHTLVFLLLWVNLFWSLFNLLPMMPLDGGTAMLSALRLKMKSRRAMEIARWVSLITAGVVGIAALSAGMRIIFLFAALSFYQTYTGRRII